LRNQATERRPVLQPRVPAFAGTLLLLVSTALYAALQTSQSGYDIPYDKPAAKWVEAVPVGNGRIGAIVFGGTEDERVQIDEDTLWGGSPHDYSNPHACASVDELRQLILVGKSDQAEKLSEILMTRPQPTAPYPPFLNWRNARLTEPKFQFTRAAQHRVVYGHQSTEVAFRHHTFREGKCRSPLGEWSWSY